MEKYTAEELSDLLEEADTLKDVFFTLSGDSDKIYIEKHCDQEYSIVKAKKEYAILTARQTRSASDCFTGAVIHPYGGAVVYRPVYMGEEE